MKRQSVATVCSEVGIPMRFENNGVETGADVVAAVGRTARKHCGGTSTTKKNAGVSKRLAIKGVHPAQVYVLRIAAGMASMNIDF